MIRTQKIILGNWWDEGGAKTFYVHRQHSFGGEGHVAYSQLLVCPMCTHIWATLKFVDEELCWPVAQFCELCHPREKFSLHPVAGSLLVEEGYGVIDDSLLAALPPELVEREFNLHLRAYT